MADEGYDVQQAEMEDGDWGQWGVARGSFGASGILGDSGAATDPVGKGLESQDPECDWQTGGRCYWPGSRC